METANTQVLTLGSDAALDFPRLRALVAGFTHSTMGRARVEALEPSHDFSETDQQHQRVAEAQALLRAGAEPRLAQLADIAETLDAAHIEGMALEGEQLRVAATQASLVHSWSALLAEPPANAESELTALREQAGMLLDGAVRAKLRSLATAIEQSLEPDGSVAESASAGLRRARREIERQQSAIADGLRATLRRLSADGSAQDDVVTIRGDRFVIPVRAEQRRRLPGVVHGASSSGQTVFVEPLETVEQNNELVRLREVEQEEIRRVLRELTRRLGEVRDEMRLGMDVLAEVDSAMARARFARSFDGVRPEFSPSDEQTLVLEEARHPLLEERLRRTGGESIPLSVTFSSIARQLIISGPNTGGKTVALKTIGLLSLMAQAGFPIPALRARLPMFAAVLADIGDAQSIERDLSTFSSHVTNIARIFRTVRELRPEACALVLLDEIGSATDPEEGAALAVATAEKFLRPRVWSVISTHFTAMKVYATGREGVINAAVGFDEATLAPTYKLRIGVPGASAGLRMAERLGLDHEIVEAARERLGTQTEEIADFLERLHRELDAVAEERAALRAREQEVARERNRLETEGRREQREKVKELERILQELIRDMELRARESVRAIDDRAAQQKLSKDAERRLAKAKREFQEQFNQAAVAATSGAHKGDPNARPHLIANIAPGDRVRLRSLGKTARVERQLDGDMFEVTAGALKMRVPRGDIAEVLPDGVGAASPLEAARGRGVRVQMSPDSELATQMEVNVIGQTADEAERNVERFLDRAFLAGLTRVRIVHGTGMGVLRRTLRTYMQARPDIEKVTEAAQNEGGAGATIVELRQ